MISCLRCTTSRYLDFQINPINHQKLRHRTAQKCQNQTSRKLSNSLMVSPRVKIFDSSARDGLQAIPTFVPTRVKINLINKLSESGLRDIEIASITKLEQMKDAAQVFQGISRMPNRRYWVLTPNLYGLEKVLSLGGNHVGLICSASNEFSIANTNSSIDEAFKKRHMPLMNVANASDVTVRAYLSCCFGFHHPEDVSENQTVHLCEKYASLGARVVICDTTNLATPDRVNSLIQNLLQTGFDPNDLAVHFHGSGIQLLDNIHAAIKLGVREIDTSLRGLGGCPAAKKAQRKQLDNAPTEDVVKWVERLGYTTDVNWEALQQAQNYISGELSKNSFPQDL